MDISLLGQADSIGTDFQHNRAIGKALRGQRWIDQLGSPCSVVKSGAKSSCKYDADQGQDQSKRGV